MAPRDYLLPNRLKRDAIVEVVFEVRFETTALPERAIGQLLNAPAWSELKQSRLQAYEIPSRMREMDQNLRDLPLWELADESGDFRVRIGPHVLSCHKAKPYSGWAGIRPRLREAIDMLCVAARGAELRRAGLRYINSLDSGTHGIRTIADLDFALIVAGKQIEGDANIALHEFGPAELESMTRIATKRFFASPQDNASELTIDIDVFHEWKESRPVLDSAYLDGWLMEAHQFEKRQFFTLLKVADIARLSEE